MRIAGTSLERLSVGLQTMSHNRLRYHAGILTRHQTGLDVVLHVFDALFVRRLVGLDHGVINRHGCPGMLLDQRATDDQSRD